MKTILFDGVCNLCNGSVNWVIDRDKNNLFTFSSLQSDYGSKRVTELGLGEKYMDTIVFDDDGVAFTQSLAVIQILRHLGGIYSLAVIFLIVPGFIRNAVYNFVASNRYKWFGKQDACRIPTPDLKAKFLE